MTGFRVRRRRSAHELEVPDADVARRAGAALFAADERIRVAAEELDFAEAELGRGSTKELSEALVAARANLGEAFRLNRPTPAAAPATAADVRTRHLRILELCESVDELLDEHTGALAERVARARRAPQVLAGVLGDIEILRTHIPQARQTLERLAARYAHDALTPIQGNPGEAEQLVAFAEHSAGVAERRRAAGQREQAHVALEASAEAVRQAANLLDAVETFELEALRAEAGLAALVEDARRDLAGGLEMRPRSRALASAIGELQAALADLPAAGVNTDPIAHVTRLRDATAALDAATAAVRERAGRPIPSLVQVQRAIDDADRQLDVAREVIAGHSGWIGPEALKRLAEAERIRVDLALFLGNAETTIASRDGEHRARVVAMAGRLAELAAEALRLARRDIRDARSPSLSHPQPARQRQP
ncbi:hypothetical protein BCL57_001536 [Agromyces flavus]|uniref:Uncharacterized protein n=1 Tax=Agromyces flavus TaxID=589382 RepID=A0A1H2A1V2_9MICO|nr:hypothetical protein [Agromyces flavus]MCP2367382.1 hypothetical protein [Agromyces flavus]GGI45838.1 hypothetical protein GCM10010932_11590 [Agromyces flavus]SDT39797.1 hypothetical protein SAMN04489721_3460 [Agromyces flavus]